MAGLESDCSMAAAIVSFAYCIINAIFLFGSIYTLIRYCVDYKKNVDRRPPKMLFIPGLIFFIFSSIALLATVRNAMSICFHGDTNYTDLSYWIYFIAFYSIQTYLLWLVLFVRLQYVFINSAYKLSKLTIRVHSAIFILLPLVVPIYFLVLWRLDGVLYTVLWIISFVFVLAFSCSLSALFVYKLYQVFKNADITSAISSPSRSQRQLTNNKLLQAITKSAILAIFSLSMTFLTPLTLLFGYYAVMNAHSQVLKEAGACLLSFASLMDVFTNYLCILLSYNCFEKWYSRMCGKVDIKCRRLAIERIMQKKSTNSGHIELSSRSNTRFSMFQSRKSTVDTITPTQITPPCGGGPRFSHDEDIVYDELDETELTRETEDVTLPTPYTPYNNDQYQYNNIPEEEEEEEEQADDQEEQDVDDADVVVYAKFHRKARNTICVHDGDEDGDSDCDDETQQLHRDSAVENTQDEGFARSISKYHPTSTGYTQLTVTNAKRSTLLTL